MMMMIIVWVLLHKVSLIFLFLKIMFFLYFRGRGRDKEREGNREGGRKGGRSINVFCFFNMFLYKLEG